MSSILSSVYPHSIGITGYSGNPTTNEGVICTDCHGGGSPPTVTLEGPTTVSPGSTNTYTLTIGGGQRGYGGLDVSVTTGTLTAIEPDTHVVEGEMTHILPKAAVGGVVTFSFKWTAPATPGSAVIYAAGSLVDGNMRISDDNADKTSLTVTFQTSGPDEADAGGVTTITATVTLTRTITSELPAQTVTSTTMRTTTVTTTTTVISEKTAGMGFPAEITYAAIGVAAIAIITTAILVSRRR